MMKFRLLDYHFIHRRTPAFLGVFAIALVTCVANGGRAQPSQPLLLGAIVQCPYICRQVKLREGMLVDMVARAAARDEIPLTVRHMSYNRAVLELQSGRIAGVIGVTEIPDHAGLQCRPLAKKRYGFFTRDNDPWHYSGIASLHARELLIREGFYHTSLRRIAAANAQFKLRPVNLVEGSDSPIALFAMLSQARGDTVLEDLNVFRHYLAIESLPDAFRYAGSLDEQTMHVCLTEKSARRERFFSQLKQIIEDEEHLKGLMADYGIHHNSDMFAVFY